VFDVMVLAERCRSEGRSQQTSRPLGSCGCGHAVSVPVQLPPDLAGPIDLALARAVDRVPGEDGMPGGSMYELKWDGYRCALVRSHNDARLWSRRGTDLTAIFPDLAAAAEFHLKPGTVLDGEAVIWDGGRLSFDHLQERMANRNRSVTALVHDHPASFAAFDLLAFSGDDIRSHPLTVRRKQLEQDAGRWAPPLQLSPMTTDYDEAMAWFEDYRPVGVEGLVVKAASGRYVGGRRDWVKVKNRQTLEVIAGAVIGPIGKPAALVAGLMREGEFVIAGRSSDLNSAQSAQLAAVLEPADRGHPWPDVMSNGVFGNRKQVALTKVRPVVVVEVSADTGMQNGRYRHPLRYVRVRFDMEAADVDPM
jgi:ATP-dependent DNA ligase